MLPSPIKKFIALFSELPSVGPRQASRFAFWFIRQGPSRIAEYSRALRSIGEDVSVCEDCFFVFEKDGDTRVCAICRDPKRNRRLLAIVEKETDLITMERTKAFDGLYHVLGGLVNPLDQDWKHTLRIPHLRARIERADPPIEEIILALPATTRGELTAEELAAVLRPLKKTITRLGKGLPRGGEVEFADEETLRAAIEHRQ
jgi:recombination protein RecR